MPDGKNTRIETNFSLLGNGKMHENVKTENSQKIDDTALKRSTAGT